MLAYVVVLMCYIIIYFINYLNYKIGRILAWASKSYFSRVKSDFQPLDALKNYETAVMQYLKIAATV
jgi:hypothetical protein